VTRGQLFPFSDHPGLQPASGYACLQQLPAFVPVTLRSGTEALLAHRHKDVRQVLTDPRFSRSVAAGFGLTSRSSESLALNAADAPDHTRRRRVIAPHFTRTRAARLLPDTARLADALLASMTSHGPPADLMTEFTIPLTMGVVSSMLGIPVQEAQELRPWVERMMSTTAFSKAEVNSAHQFMYRFFEELLNRRADADHGLLGELASAARERGEITCAEAVHLAYGLLIAGYETTSNQLGMCVLVLLQNPALATRLRTRPALLPGAIEEMLRWTSLNATGGVPHTALCPVKIGETLIDAGQVVVPATDGANRDPDTFRCPDQLRLDRIRNPHLSFGHGRHLCPGAALARMELEVALSTLLARLPGLALDAPEELLRWRTGMYVRGVWNLPVRW
jgi:cytochrome P450